MSAPPATVRVLEPALLLVAILLAYLGQMCVSVLGAAARGVPLLALAGVLGGWVLHRLAARLPNAEAPAAVVAWWQRGSTHRWTMLAIVGLLALAVAAASIALVRDPDRVAVTTLLWISALGLLLGAGVGWDWQVWWPRRGERRFRDSILLLIVILAVATALRVIAIDQFPADVHGDEAASGLQTRDLLHGRVPTVFQLGWAGLPILGFVPRALSMAAFGDELAGLRLGSSVPGILSVLVLYVLGRRLFSPRVGFIAASLLAMGAWHIHFSRSGSGYMLGSFTELLSLYLTIRALEDGRLLDAVLAGFALGFCFDVYFAARLTPALVALLVAYRAATERLFLRRTLPSLAVITVAAVAFIAPMVPLLVGPERGMAARTDAISVFNNREHVLASTGTKSLPAALLVQARRTVEAFNVRGESSQQYFHRGAPLFDVWTGPWLVLGLLFVTSRLRDWRYVMVSIWVWLTLFVGSVLTVDALFAPRVVGVVPALALVQSLALAVSWHTLEYCWGRNGDRLGLALIAGLLLLGAVANRRDYFQQHVTQFQPAGFNTLLGRFIQQHNDRYRVYLLGTRDTTLDYDTIRFLAPGLDGTDLRDQMPPLPLQDLSLNKGVAFVIQAGAPQAEERLTAIEAAYPGGRATQHFTVRGDPAFTVYAVEREQLQPR